MKFLIIFFLIGNNLLLLGQTISGTVFEMDGDVPIEYVSIGIIGKNVGAVSDQNGRYILQINPEYHNDTLRFSYIGYRSYSVKVSDFINRNNWNVSLEKRDYELTELLIRPRNVRQRRLGITAGKIMSTSFCYLSNSGGGHETGILINNNKTVFVKEVNINVADFDCDTAFFRINFYKPIENQQFDNVLSNPIYHSITKQDIKNGKITIDLRQHNLVIEHDFLVTYEHLDLQGAIICFCANPFRESYRRRVSFGTWVTTTFGGISISVLVDVER